MKKCILALILVCGLPIYSHAEKVNTDEVIFLDDEEDDIDREQ